MWETILAFALPFVQAGLNLGTKYLETKRAPTPAEVAGELSAATKQADANLDALIASIPVANGAGDHALEDAIAAAKGGAA